MTLNQISKNKTTKLPPGFLFSPAGIILISFSLVTELIDYIPVPGLDQLLEISLEIILLLLIVIILKPSLKSLIIPIVLERIPIVSDIIPTWFISIIKRIL